MPHFGVGKQERLAITPLTWLRWLFLLYLSVVLQLFEVLVTANFLNNPQRNSSVAYLSQGYFPKTVGGGSLNVGSLKRYSGTSTSKTLYW